MKRYYVTMTWEQWPEDGSYGTVVEAADYDDAVKRCRQEMAKIRSEEREYDPSQWTDDENSEDWIPPEDREDSPEWILSEMGDDWALVDCFDLDEFIAMHSRKEN